MVYLILISSILALNKCDNIFIVNFSLFLWVQVVAIAVLLCVASGIIYNDEDKKKNFKFTIKNYEYYFQSLITKIYPRVDLYIGIINHPLYNINVKAFQQTISSIHTMV